MINQIFKLAVSNGLWATLFVVLLFYVLKDSTEREKKYQITISTLSKHLGVVNDIKDEVQEINKKIKPCKSKGVKTNETQLEKENI